MARRPRLWIAGWVAACAPLRPQSEPVVPLSPAPDIRIAVALEQQSLTLGGGGSLTLATPTGGWLGEIPASSHAVVELTPQGLKLRTDGGVLTPGASLLVAGSSSPTPVRINGRDYRGTVAVESAEAGIRAVNLLDLEDYLVGVVGAELGSRGEADLSALRAQAVVSRTIALQRAQRSRDRSGSYDLLATVQDQLYAGVSLETPLARQAVQDTRGEVLTWQGRIIDGFFHSTCGGRTAAGSEVFAAADRPYLRSVSDLDGAGRAWCAISPRYRWRESWSEAELAGLLRETLPAAGGRAELAAELRDIRITERTPTGRVARMEIAGSGGSVRVSGPVARQVLRRPDGGLLRSAGFTLELTRTGERIVRLTAEGAGAGHGVGLCQWGAIGRSRAGFSYPGILTAYFPGTELSRLY